MHIRISNLELWTRIGVPDFERAQEQCVRATINFECTEEASRTDDIAKTVDYEKVVIAIKAAATKEHHTLEKFAQEIADAVLTFDRVQNVSVSLTKFVLPGTEGVTITLTRP